MSMAKSRYEMLLGTMDDLLGTAYAGEKQANRRRQIVMDCVRRKVSDISPWAEDADIDHKVSLLSPSAMTTLENHCLYFGSRELVPVIVGRYVKRDPLLQERAICYIDNKLLANDFKWIARYDSDRNACFKTYISQYIYSRLLDFLRAQKKTDEVIDRHIDHENCHHQMLANAAEKATVAVNPLADDPATAIDREKKSQLAREIFQASSLVDVEGRVEKNRHKLREFLDLSAKDSAFLRALYFDNLTINQVRKLPGINLGVSQAYQYRDDLLLRITQAMREAGILNDIREASARSNEKLEVLFEEAMLKVDIGKILYLQETSNRTTSCHAQDKRGNISQGTIEQSFHELKKRFRSYFVPINRHTVVAYDHIDTISKSKKSASKYEVKMRRFGEIFLMPGGFKKRYFEKY